MPTDEEVTKVVLQFIAAAKAEVPENSKPNNYKKAVKIPISGRFDEENLQFLSALNVPYTTMMNCLVSVLREESTRLGLYTPPSEPTSDPDDLPKVGMG